MPLQAFQSVKVKTGDQAGRAGHVTNGDRDAAIARCSDHAAPEEPESRARSLSQLQHACAVPLLAELRSHLVHVRRVRLGGLCGPGQRGGEKVARVVCLE